jgi:acylphosphatase
VIRRRVVATGLVQGVFYRDSCRREAQQRRVAGWVTNRPDGAVEAVFEGGAADVEALVEWARRGPRQAQVDDLRVIEEDPVGERGFTVR